MRARHLLLLPALLLLGSCLVISSCVIVAGDNDERVHHADGDDHHAPEGRQATARIEGKSGIALRGQATFHETEGGVLIQVEVENAPPGWHAVHIHETGDCSSEDGKSAGGHFNPAGVEHGSPHAEVHHAGDLGNMEVKANGRGYHAIFMPELSVAGGEFSVVGRGIIVHAGADDLVSQPTGAAGGRIGCGVIQ